LGNYYVDCVLYWCSSHRLDCLDQTQKDRQRVHTNGIVQRFILGGVKMTPIFFSQIVRFFYDGFKPHRYYWEILIITRKLLIVVFIIIFRNNILHQIYGMMFVVQAGVYPQLTPKCHLDPFVHLLISRFSYTEPHSAATIYFRSTIQIGIVVPGRYFNYALCEFVYRAEDQQRSRCSSIVNMCAASAYLCRVG
jgi:hypothetical protein